MLKLYRYELIAVILVTLGSLLFAAIERGFDGATELNSNEAQSVVFLN